MQIFNLDFLTYLDIIRPQDGEYDVLKNVRVCQHHSSHDNLQMT